MNPEEKKKVVVVLGMHRSGTSAITRGLTTLGIDLGDRLMPAKEGNNEKGFWEDIDINALNIEILRSIGHEWHSNPSITRSELKSITLQEFRLRAVELLRKKTQSSPIWGMKDPRVSRLLVFWNKVFEHMGFDALYVIAFRHPISVARSLLQRDGFAVEKSHYLWLAHFVPSIIDSLGYPGVVVDYDLFMDQPEAQLARIADRLGLSSQLNASEVEDYKSNFLEQNLRHTRFQPEDLALDPAVPKQVIEAYDILRKLANDELSIDAPAVKAKFAQLADHLQDISPATRYMAKLEDDIARLDHIALDREAQLADLNQAVTKRDVQIASLNHTLAERDVQIASLNHTLAERDVQIGNLSQVVVERDEQIAGLAQAVHDNEVQIGNLDRALREREEQIGHHVQAISEIRRSTSWRLTSPVRLLGRQVLRVKIVLKALPYALVACGGYRGLVKQVWRAYKNEDIGGIKRRVFSLASRGPHPPLFSEAEPNYNDYGEWVRRYDTLSDQDREDIRAQIRQLLRTPLISLVMPVYNPPLDMLEEAIRSVQDQLYPNWELCIADDASTDMRVHKLLRHYADNDPRIKVVFREQNGHISAASNSALELAKGEFVALLDNDDLLREQALFWVADAIATHPDAGVIYSDEDKIDRSGQRYDPYFKPDWNPDLFLSHNMICHLGAYRTDLVREIDGFRVGYEGAQDYDLALRCCEQLTPQQIVHIPRVLYHWRAHPGSTAQAGSEKNYALLAGERALNDHFARTKVSAKAELLDFGMYRARYAIPTPAPLVSLIIPTRNGLSLIKQCIESIFAKTTYKNLEILIVDNNSDDPDTLTYLASLAEDHRVRILRDERPFNYSAMNNAAAQQARGEYLGLINNDIDVISPEWLDEMMGLAIQPGIGAVGARLWYPNDTLQHGGVITGLGGVAGHSHKDLPKGAPGFFYRAQLIQTLSAVTAACLVVKKSIFQEVGGLNEIEFKVAFNDVDFCLRVREAGYRNVWTPYAELYHHESATRGYEDTPEKKLRFQSEIRHIQKRWGALLMSDPAYSPNLTLDREDFSYAWPPRLGS